jgi:hypothetical protein
MPMSSWCRSPFFQTYQVMWDLLQCLRSRLPFNHRAVLQVPFREGTTPSTATLASSKMPPLESATSAPWVHTSPVQTSSTRARIARRVGMASLAVPSPTSPTAPSVQAATMGRPCAPSRGESLGSCSAADQDL